MTAGQLGSSPVRPTPPCRAVDALNGTELIDAELPVVEEFSLSGCQLTCASIIEAVRRSTGAG